MEMFGYGSERELSLPLVPYFRVMATPDIHPSCSSSRVCRCMLIGVNVAYGLEEEA